jgi:hypothetical protein
VPPKLNDEHRAFLAEIVEQGPGCAGGPATIMRLYEEFGLSVSDDTVYRALKDLGFSHVSARPKAYRQAPEAIAAFKKTSPVAWRQMSNAETYGLNSSSSQANEVIYNHLHPNSFKT